jgi:hypothetical protein
VGTSLLPVLIALLVAIHASTAAPAVATQAPLSVEQAATYANAVAFFRERRYAAAYGRFTALADAGHVPSAQLALVMHANGQSLFGSEWQATPVQQRRWSALVIEGERSRLSKNCLTSLVTNASAIERVRCRIDADEMSGD